VFVGRQRAFGVLTTKACPASSYIGTMRRTAWIWFVGCAAWLADGVVQLRLHARPHAQLAFMVALMFLVAGLYYRRQPR
jgi:hypothetical protein